MSPVLLRALRDSERLTQVQFAARLGIPVDTLRGWEQGKRKPQGPSRRLLDLYVENVKLKHRLVDCETITQRRAREAV